MPPWRLSKEVETCRRTATYLHIIVYDCAAAVGIYTMMVEYMCARKSRLFVWWFSDTLLWSINDLPSDRIRYRIFSTQYRNNSPSTCIIFAERQNRVTCSVTSSITSLHRRAKCNTSTLEKILKCLLQNWPYSLNYLTYLLHGAESFLRN